MTTKKYKNKIAAASTGETPDSFISDSFGRCPFIILYDTEDKNYRAIENTGAKVQDGSGLRAAEILIQNKADVLLTMELGRKAYSVLTKEHVDIHLLQSAVKVKTAINNFLKEQVH